MKAKFIPVITGATETISKSFRQYLINLPGKHEIQEQQKYSHFVQCTQTAESADVKVHNIFHGRNNTTYSINCECRTAATLYSVETWFGSDI